MLPPLDGTTKASDNGDFGARSRSFSTCSPTLRTSCCHSRARLASGWLAFAGRASNPLDHSERFQFTWSSSSPGILTLSFFPFQTTYYLNGHSFIEQELKRAQIGFRKNDNAFLAVDDVVALQAAADRLSPEIIRKRLDYWTLILGPKFSAKERTCHASMPSARSSTAVTSFSGGTFPSTSCSSEVANSACGGSPPTRLPRSSAPACTAGTAASSP